ncbi:MAG: S41 family peptidase [Muribaculaceae bacterium]|nr:S41 family peptidase [Muribaculaceae bacterium]
MLKFRYLSPFFILLAVFSTLISSCHEVPDYKDDPVGNFDALADIVGQRYCYFEEKGIDWKAVVAKHRERVTSETPQLELFEIMSDLLDELKDGHVNLSSRFSTSYYRKWWSDYPQNFNLRTLQQYYLDFDYMQVSGMSYKMLPDSIGYIYCPSFSSQISETSLDYVFAVLYGVEKAKGMIIDIRNNGGGLLTNINTFVGRFIDEEIPGGYIRHKTGPGATDFSKPYPITYKPASDDHIRYIGPIIVLTNRSCYSAANNFVAVMKSLPNVRICGSTTGGGGGLPFTSEIPNGWAVRFSSCPITDPEDQATEFGIEPSKGYEVDCTDEELAQGKDAILDFAIEVYRRAFEEAEKNKAPKCMLPEL